MGAVSGMVSKTKLLPSASSWLGQSAGLGQGSRTTWRRFGGSSAITSRFNRLSITSCTLSGFIGNLCSHKQRRHVPGLLLYDLSFDSLCLLHYLCGSRHWKGYDMPLSLVGVQRQTALRKARLPSQLKRRQTSQVLADGNYFQESIAPSFLFFPCVPYGDRKIMSPEKARLLLA